MVPALLREIELRQSYLGGQTVETIYFGGGTPSLLPVEEIGQIIAHIQSVFPVSVDPEVTLEANPDDMSQTWLEDLRTHTPVNRLSVGIQSFYDEDLRWMNRAHNAGHARQCVEQAQAAGFDNLTIDLIFGAPTTTDAVWSDNLAIAFDLGVPHLSCYGLTVEADTALGRSVLKGKMPAPSDEQSARQFAYLMEASAAAGYEQYEISNFARNGMYARHNSNYWLGSHYLGIGPSAHSYDGASRQWNVSNNARYLVGIEKGEPLVEREVLSDRDRFNEYVLTMLRTQWGCRLEAMEAILPEAAAQFVVGVEVPLSKGEIIFQEGSYRLTNAGRFVADRIASELFFG